MNRYIDTPTNGDFSNTGKPIDPQNETVNPRSEMDPQIERQQKLLSLIAALPDKLLPDDSFHKDADGMFINPAEEIKTLLLADEARPFFNESSEEHADGTLDAASSRSCILDYVRTKKFAEAIQAHIKEIATLKSEGEIVVVDAGCGALPILSVIAAISSPRVNVIAIEKTENSVRSAELTIKKMGLENQIQVVSEDASTITLKKAADLIVSETLYSAFYEEPFVRIMGNLSPQMSEVGRTIPEKISVEVAVGASNLNSDQPIQVVSIPGMTILTRIPALQYSNVYTWKPGDHPDKLRLPFELDLDKVRAGQHDHVFARSNMLLKSGPGDEEIRLNPDESLITEAVWMFSVKNSILSDLEINPEWSQFKSWRSNIIYAPGCGSSLHISDYKRTNPENL
jgi:hypothetical protein